MAHKKRSQEEEVKYKLNPNLYKQRKTDSTEKFLNNCFSLGRWSWDALVGAGRVLGSLPHYRWRWRCPARPCLSPTVRSKGHVSSAVSWLAPLVLKVTDLMGEIASVLEPKHIKILTRSSYPVFLCPGIIYSPVLW